MFKVFKRYTTVALLIFLCFFSAFISLCNGLVYTSQANDLIRIKRQYAYANEINLIIQNLTSISYDDLKNIVSSIKSCNIYIENMKITFDEIDGTYKPDLILISNEVLSLPTSKEITSIHSNCIIASSTIDYETLSTHNSRFTIIDKMDAKAYPFISTKFVMNADDYFKIYPHTLIQNNEIVLRISSNSNNVMNVCSELNEVFSEKYPDALIYSSAIRSADDAFQSIISTENIISVGLFLFALINIVIISYYWIVVRRKEIAIRKAYGASDFRIIQLMCEELFSIILVAGVSALLIQVIIWKMQEISIGIENAIYWITTFLAAITVSIFVSMLIPMRYILNIHPSEGVKM